MVGLLGVAVFLFAVIMRLATAQSTIHLLGFSICASHLVLGANTLILIALLFRSQETPEKK